VREYDFEPNLTHANPEGGEIIATEELLIYRNDNGAVTKTAPNGRMAFRLIEGDKLSPQAFARVALDAMRAEVGTPRPTVATKNSDDALMEGYMQHAGLTGYPLKEAREMWALFRELCPGVKLANATRDHGRKLVAHFEAQRPPVKAATIQHKIARLTAACNFQISEGRLTFNPFSGVVKKPKRGEAGASDRRKSFTDRDMKVICANLGKLTVSDRLLVTILATTGCRLGEALSIKNEEEKERGVRSVTIGTKTETSERRIPFPAKLLPLLPAAIKGPLFPTDDGHKASSRLNRWLRKECGITDKDKVIHSFRHRAQDKLRAAGCPEDKRWAILGHEKRTVAEGYGEGFPMPVLRKWIDRIGL